MIQLVKFRRPNVSVSRHWFVHRRRFSKWSVDPETGIVSSSSSSSPTKEKATTQQQLFQTVIGLEIHAQLDISTKLFSGCPVPKTSSLNQKPNTFVWPLDVGVPGFLPRLSQEAVQAAVLSAAATKCDIPFISRFERKHYFYADLPLGYQITQQRWPLARDGILVCHRQSNKKKGKKKKTTSNSLDDTFSVRIQRIQLEQDTGKTTMITRNGVTKSLVDFNRAGCALIEIVFYPDLRSPRDAACAVETLRNLLRHIGTCDGKMEEGSLRCDLNVSIAAIADNEEDTLDIVELTGNRVEVKNLNSLRQVQLAAEYEAIRQASLAVIGDPTGQETRTFDVKTGKTIVIRTKEGAKDYRFMPEPDLPPLVLNSEAFDGLDLETFLKNNLPELPEDARNRLQGEYGLSDYLASVLTGDPPAIQMFDEAVQAARLQLGNGGVSSSKANIKAIPEVVANLLCNELFALVRDSETHKKSVEELILLGGDASVKFSKVSGKQLGEIVALLMEETISNTMAKQLLKILYHENDSNKNPREVALERGFRLITNSGELKELCMKIINESPEELERYKLGDKYARKITKFLVGKAMSTSQMNAHPERLNEIMQTVLQEVASSAPNS